MILRTNSTRRTVARVTAGAAGVAAFALVLTGCSGSGAASGSDTTVALSVAKLTDPFQLAMIADAKTAAKKEGVSLGNPVNANNNAGQQVTDMGTILNSSPSAVIVGPIDAKAIVPAITKANNAKVPVIALDQAPAGGKVAMTVRADNTAMGATGCENLGKLTGGKGTVVEVQGDLSSANGLQRSQGFEQCMKSKFPNVKVIEASSGAWDLAKATAAVQTITSTNDVDGIFIASDYFLPGIQKVLKSQNKWVPTGEPGHVFLQGIDGTSDGLKLIRDGYYDGVVSQPANLYAQYAVKYAKEAAEGKTFSAGKTDHDSTIVKTASGPADLLPAPLVTKSNVDDDTLWGNAK